jgi:HSP20 family protein
MQNYRISNKLPQAYRIIKVTPQATPVRTMFSFPRFPSGEFAPLFRLLDDYASHQSSRQGDDLSNFGNISQLRSFQPRFDVKEVKDSYELHGELPGVEQKDIQIEFTDAQTLSIKGRTERHRESGTPPTAALEGQQEQGRITGSDETSSDTSSHHYQKPTVEDENATPSTNTEQQITTTNADNNQVQQQEPQRPQSRYWVSERSVGEFSRSFAFPSRVDQDNVRASLKDGILSIVVPKASAPTTRKIHIE